MGNKITLASSNVRTPDYRDTGSSLYRTSLHGNLVPLVSQSIEFAQSGIRRSDQPTRVSIVLDKIESIQNGLLENNSLSLLGFPERVTLVAGDLLSVYAWAGNYTTSQTPVILGVMFSGVDVKALLCSMTLGPALGGGAVNIVPYKKPVNKRNALFCQRLDRGRHGGFLLEGTVLEPPSGQSSWEVEVRAVAAFSGHELKQELPITYDVAKQAYDSNHSNAALHQQGQFYGDYGGSVAIDAGSSIVVAAPGSWGYHGSGWQGLQNPDLKQAAYWIPLRISLQGGRKPPNNLKIIPETGRFVDPRALEIVAEYPDGKVKGVRTDTSFPFVNEMRVNVTFLGTSATSLAIRGL